MVKIDAPDGADRPLGAGANSLKLINFVDHGAALTVVHFGRHRDANLGAGDLSVV